MKQTGQETLFADSIIFSFVFNGADKYPLLFLVVQYRQPAFTHSDFHNTPFPTSICMSFVCMVSDSISFDAREISVVSARRPCLSSWGDLWAEHLETRALNLPLFFSFSRTSHAT
jgi:hypothetical protein